MKLIEHTQLVIELFEKALLSWDYMGLLSTQWLIMLNHQNTLLVKTSMRADAFCTNTNCAYTLLDTQDDMMKDKTNQTTHAGKKSTEISNKPSTID